MATKKRGFFERLTGSIKMDDEYEPEAVQNLKVKEDKSSGSESNWMEEENDEAELAVDVFQTNTEIVVQTFVAGVKTDDLPIYSSRHDNHQR